MCRDQIILATAILALVFLSPVSAQESGTGSITVGQENGVISGGGDGQFPEGTSNCSGSRFHHAHDYPTRFSCSKVVNPHYSTTKGSDPCTQRSKTDCGCEDCCRKQTSEAKTCFCAGNKSCKSLADYAETTCKGNCLSTYLDTCDNPDFSEG